MAIAASMLRNEMRRHLLMNVTLVASCVVGGTVVTNERGLFVPIGIHGMSETARAFAAMFTQSRLMAGEDMPSVQMVSPLDPFEVTADSRDLRRRLMDALGFMPDEVANYNRELAQANGQPGSFGNGASMGETLTVADSSGATNNGTTGGNSSGSSSSSSSTAQPASSSGVTEGASSSPLTGSNTSDVLPTTTQLTSPDVTPTQAETATQPTQPPPDTGVGAVPEPSSWAMLIAGFGMIGYFLRNARRRARAEAEAAA